MHNLILFRPLEVLVIDHFASIANISAQILTKDLPQPLPKITLTVSFTQLGGDSIAAMRLASLIEEHFNRQISVHTIMAEPLQNILRLIVNKPLSFIESCSPINWSKEVLLDFVTQESQDDSSSSAHSEKINVFMTGATGFLGRFILLELLRNPKCHLVYCLARNTNGTVFKYHAYVVIIYCLHSYTKGTHLRKGCSLFSLSSASTFVLNNCPTRWWLSKETCPDLTLIYMEMTTR